MTNRKMKLMLFAFYIISLIVFSLLFSLITCLFSEGWHINQTLIATVLYGVFNAVTFSVVYKLNKDD